MQNKFAFPEFFTEEQLAYAEYLLSDAPIWSLI